MFTSEEFSFFKLIVLYFFRSQAWVGSGIFVFFPQADV